jgi:hypothetical protein
MTIIYSGASVYECPFTNKFSEQKTPRVTNGVLDYEHNLATAASWEYQRGSQLHPVLTTFHLHRQLSSVQVR